MLHVYRWMAILLFAAPCVAFSNLQYCLRLLKLAETVPAQDTHIDESVIARWVAAHRGRARKVAEIVQQHLRLIEREEFYRSVDRAVHEFRAKNIAPEDAVFVYYGRNPRLEKAPHKSGGWMMGYIY